MTPQPCLRIFLSADLAGSTAFKQSRSAVDWQRFFGQFYRQLPAYVDREFPADSHRLTLWKTVGDEIVFSAELKASDDVPRMIDAFRRGVAAYRSEIRESPGDLDIKCAGWTAGFPVGNLMVDLPGEPSQRDYIGPGMDIGFRLVKESGPRRMLLSVELAYILSLDGLEGPEIRTGRGMELKGVGKGRRYPCLWLDCFTPEQCTGWDRIELEEEDLSGTTRPRFEAAKMNSFCRNWLKEMGSPFVIPFIKGDSRIGDPPADFETAFREVTTQTQGAEDLGAEMEDATGAAMEPSPASLDDYFTP